MGKQTGTRPRAIRLLVPLQTFLLWLFEADANPTELLLDGRIVVDSPSLCGCYHLSVGAAGDLKFKPAYCTVRQMSLVLLELGVDYDKECRRVSFHTVTPGSWSDALSVLHDAVSALQMHQCCNFNAGPSHRPPLPPTWGLMINLDMPIVVWARPLRSTPNVHVHSPKPTCPGDGDAISGDAPGAALSSCAPP